jgi:hypothetical protein
MLSLCFMAMMAILLCGVPGALAQYKAPSQYFRKDFPAPNPGGQSGAPKSLAAPAPAAPQQPKFKDVVLNSQFYFVTDTNRAYAWTKISGTSAKNTKSGVTQIINGETPVQR